MKKFVPSAIVLILTGGFFLWQGIYLPKSSNDGEKIFEVKKGEGLLQIAKNLEKEGLIKSRIFFDLYVASGIDQGRLKAGFYSFNSSMAINSIAQKIILGDAAKMIVTIPEGFTQKQIEERLGVVLPEDSEGYLFPDTYEFPFGVKGEDAVRIMRQNFDQKTSGLAATKEVVIMASILEKEVKTKEEKELASGVLWKRLRAGMPLQVDAERWTYENLGLPPAPIANPGLESIESAILPKESPYWYYLSTPDGKTIFSRNLVEHNLAKAKYLR